MQEELINLVLQYVNQQKEIDDEFINKTIMIAKHYYNLNEYIKEICNLKKNWSCEASYIFDSKTIITDTYLILKSLNNVKNEFICIKDSQIFKYLYFIQVILHEVEHAKQQKMINEDYGVETEILKAECAPIYKVKDKMIIKRIYEYNKLQKMRKKFYTFSPSERLAQIKSLEFVTDISKILEDEFCYDVMQYYKLKNLLRGYNVGLINNLSDEPTKYFLQQTNPVYDFENIIKMSEQLPKNDLIKFGLKSSSEDLDKISEDCMRLVLKLTNNKIN